MTDLEISKALALAIGWREDQIIEYEDQDYIGLPVVINRPAVRMFSYKAWNVIGPIAERYDAFPLTSDSRPGVWFTRVRNQNRIGVPFTYADTPQKAIAMAVINGAKK